MRGVGFKVFAKDGKLTFNLGYSHQVFFELPYGITSKVLDEKNTIFYLFGNSRDLVTATAFEICSLKKKDAYKGKGINFYSAILKLKEGKSKKKT